MFFFFHESLKYSSEHVRAATGIAPQTQHLYVARYGLFLVSDRPGRGRPRMYTLLDLVLLYVAGRLSHITGDTHWACSSVNLILLGEAKSTLEIDRAVISETRQKWRECEQWPECFSGAQPDHWFLVAQGVDHTSPGSSRLLSPVLTNQPTHLLSEEFSGVVANLTQMHATATKRAIDAWWSDERAPAPDGQNQRGGGTRNAQ